LAKSFDVPQGGKFQYQLPGIICADCLYELSIIKAPKFISLTADFSALVVDVPSDFLGKKDK